MELEKFFSIVSVAHFVLHNDVAHFVEQNELDHYYSLNNNVPRISNFSNLIFVIDK